MAAPAQQRHHRIPRCLVGFLDRAREGELDAAGLQAWFDWEEEAYRYSVDPDISRDELLVLVEASAASLPTAEHTATHSTAGDFARWGRMGGLATLSRYGRAWFSLLARRRWGRVEAEALTRYRAEGIGAKGRAV